MDANMVTDDEAPNDDDSFVQLVSIAKKGDGFDGFCMTDPLNQNDAGEPNACDHEKPQGGCQHGDRRRGDCL